VALSTFRTQIAAGEWFLDGSGGGVRAALRFLWADPQLWGEQLDDAGYVHGLMIDRAHAGERVGRGVARLGGGSHPARACAIHRTLADAKNPGGR
jgi:hypothetical protein